MVKILFVCLGNICRSVAAEGILKTMVARVGFENQFFIDSAGLIDYHEGELADPRMRYAASRRGYNLTHRSRPVKTSDFFDFDIIIPMDDDNVRRLNLIMPKNPSAKIVLAAELFSEQSATTCVPDPYYMDAAGFEYCLDQLEDVCCNIIKRYAQ